jgi:hypothetical protein
MVTKDRIKVALKNRARGFPIGGIRARGFPTGARFSPDRGSDTLTSLGP